MGVITLSAENMPETSMRVGFQRFQILLAQECGKPASRQRNKGCLVPNLTFLSAF